MTIGFIGLGKMGSNMIQLLMEKGHEVVAYDVHAAAVDAARVAGAQGVDTLESLVEALDEGPRAVWIMVPRQFVQDVLTDLTPLLVEGDTIIEGGNTYFADTVVRAQQAKDAGVHYLDVGVSGGVDGARNGACMMIGGDRARFDQYEELFRDLTVTDGYGYMGTSGTGHYVKMVHNGIEYGMMSAIGQGITALAEYESPGTINLQEAIKVYGHGSIIESNLMTWLADAWKKDPALVEIDGEVPYGETEKEMERLEKLAHMSVLTAARESRVGTRGEASFFGKIINALRFEFGGHLTNK